MSYRRFADAVSGAGQAPCEKFSCQLRDQCGRDELACGAFLFYVESGLAVNPRAKVRIFGNRIRLEKDKRGVICLDDAAVASRWNFRRLGGFGAELELASEVAP